MGLFERLKDVTSFLTIIPVKTVNQKGLESIADHMYFFPLLGGLIGFLAGGFAWLLLHLLPSMIVGVLAIGFILIFTGFHHIDGLLDFGDGLMVQGTPKEKLEVMKDNRLGTGGFTLTLIVILTSILCVSHIPQNLIFQGLIVSEVSAKLSMVILARIGKSAHEGLNIYFVDAMHKHLWHLRIATAISLSAVIAIFLLKITGAAMLVSGVITSFVVLGIANRHFKGVTGDVFGAANEISRTASLLTILLVV